MNKSHFVILFIGLISHLSLAQSTIKPNDEFKFFDEEYVEISKTEFDQKRRQNRLLSVQGDSLHHKILSVREIQGKIKNRKYLDSLLTLSSNIKIDSTKPLVIIFYPGKDPCNSSGSATRRSRKRWYNAMEKGINKIKASNIIYVYKSEEGLYGKNDAYKEWIKDPEQTVEKLFFKKHYPCSSFVVIAEDNWFISYFGEFGKDFVWTAMELLYKK